MKRMGLLIGAAGFLVAGTAFAGYSYWDQVTITPTSAKGTVPGAYFASDTNQEINCMTSASPQASGYCYAYDSTNAYKTCHTSNAAQIATMQSVGPFSYIFFSLAADNYTCGQVAVENGSRYASY